MSDLIERQAAKEVGSMTRERQIEILNNMRNDVYENSEEDQALYYAIRAIEALEQPEIIRCKDCTYQVESWIGMKYCEVNGDHIGVDYDYCSNARRKENG